VEGFPTACPGFGVNLILILLNFQWQKYSKFNSPCTIGLNGTKPCSRTSTHLGLLKVQRVQWGQRDLTMTKQNQECITLWPCQLHQKSIFWQKKNYENSNISQMKKDYLQKIL
jgi:hypothetical protein